MGVGLLWVSARAAAAVKESVWGRGTDGGNGAGEGRFRTSVLGPE